MRIKEIAEFTGKNRTTIERWCAKCTERSIAGKLAEAKKGDPADLDLKEVEAVLRAGTLSKDAVTILMQNARSGPVQSSILTEKDLALISSLTAGIVTKIMENMNMRVGAIESKIEERRALLPAPSIKPRDHVNMLVRNYAKDTGVSFREAWGLLYKEYSYRTHSNPRTVASNRKMKVLDYIEEEGEIGTLEAVAIEVLK